MAVGQDSLYRWTSDASGGAPAVVALRQDGTDLAAVATCPSMMQSQENSLRFLCGGRAEERGRSMLLECSSLTEFPAQRWRRGP